MAKKDTAAKEKSPEGGLGASDDLHAHEEKLGKKMDEAATIIEEWKKGGAAREVLVKKLTGSEKLPSLLQSLSQLRDAQLERNGLVLQMDLADGSYDNAPTDRKLNSQINWLSNLNISLNKMFGTRMSRKFIGFFTRTMPNWIGVEWMAFKDGMKHLLMNVAMVGAAGAALTVGGYSLAYGGFTPGMKALGGHLAPAVPYVQGLLGKAGSGIQAGWKGLYGKITGK